MGKALGSVPIIGGLFGGSGSVGASNINAAAFDEAKAAAPAQAATTGNLAQQVALQNASNGAQTNVLKQEGLAAQGLAPSLATVQMKAAQDRSLAQQLAATQAGRGGSAANSQRSLMEAKTANDNALAAQNSQNVFQSQNQFMNQANMNTQNLNSTAQSQLSTALEPMKAQQQLTLAQTQQQDQMNMFNEQQSQAAIGGLLGGAATASGLGGFAAAAKHASGGEIEGPGTEKSDSIPAMLSKGEFVVKAEAVKRPGMLEHLHAINDGAVRTPPQQAMKAEAQMGAESGDAAGYADGGEIESEASPINAESTEPETTAQAQSMASYMAGQKHAEPKMNKKAQAHAAKGIAHLMIAQRMGMH